MTGTRIGSWRVLQRAAVAEPGSWPRLDVVPRPVGLTHAAVQIWSGGTLIPPLQVSLRGTNLAPGAPDAGWVSLGALTLSPETPSALFGVGGLVDLTPFRWLRAAVVGGPRPCALIVVFDGDIPPME